MIRRFIRIFFESEKGTTAIEYALVAGLIFLAIVLAVGSLGVAVTNLYKVIADNFPK